MKVKPTQTAFLLIRITMGINFLMHGLVRLPKLGIFKAWLVSTFEASILPSWTVTIWASILPFIEFAIGILLVLGLWTYKSSIAGAITIIILLLGSSLLEKWEWVGIQMIYAVFFYFLISQSNDDIWCLDSMLKTKKHLTINN